MHWVATQKELQYFFFFQAAQKCYGGVARLKKTVDTLMKRHNGNAVFLIAGDFYQGNLWYTHFKWPVVAEFANILNFTAMVNS